MFVDVTLNGEMKRRVEKTFKKNKMKVKVVEKIRRMVKKELQRSNPYEWEHCGRRRLCHVQPRDTDQLPIERICVRDPMQRLREDCREDVPRTNWQKHI